MANASKQRDDVFRYNALASGEISADLAGGYDVVELGGEEGLTQVRLSFTSSEVGNGAPADSNTLANQDGGLAVRVQAEGSDGALISNPDRFDDEGISFVSDGSFTFDVRDLVSGVQRGDQFLIARLGTDGADFYREEDGTAKATYINAGRGDDIVRTAAGNDFLVGGAGDDELVGGKGNDSYIGGAGNDTIIDPNQAGGEDTFIFNVLTDGADTANLGGGRDVVNVSAATATQVRLTFTSAEVGNDRALDGGGASQDGGLAVRLQAEDGSGALTNGLVSRFDDEGIIFVGGAGVTFDVRDLVTGAERGEAFNVVQLGSFFQDVIDVSDRSVNYYINAGAGNDR
ncbi:MAG TPA: hypothetical protein VF636_10915, partial [Sphingomonas sp.]